MAVIAHAVANHHSIESLPTSTEEQGRHDGTNGGHSMILILTALDTEYIAVREHLVNIETRRHLAGTLFEVGTIASHPGSRIMLGATGPGNLTAATLTERAIGLFRPAAMMFVGVAGGLRDWLNLGDVVVATRMYAYHGGRSENDEFLVRPRAWEISHAIEQTARQIHRTSSWRALLPPVRSQLGCAPDPAVWFEPIAAGEVVLNSRTSAQAQQLRRHYNDAIAVEMEGAGFALAGHLNGTIPAAVVRAVSDHAGGRKDATDADGWQSIAARNAAAFAVALAAVLDVDANNNDHTAAQPAATAAMPAMPVVHNTNIAQGNARVGQQNGISFGSYYAGSRSTGERE
jgi:adenosylhomocysteine nucleosidase